MSKVKKLALCALMTASSIVVMFLGSISGFLDICTAAVAALIVAFCSVEMGAGYGWLVYLASGAVSLLILPAKEAAWSFALFFGLHALLIPLMSKLPRWASFLIRLLIMNGTLVLIYVIFQRTFADAGRNVDENSRICHGKCHIYTQRHALQTPFEVIFL